MQPVKSISIPQPCHELWHNMAPVEQGRHCQSCCKTVVDFMQMTSNEVISYLAAKHNVCGRFSAGQLGALNNTIEVQNRGRFSWKGLVAAASLLTIIINIKATAQTVHPTEQNIAPPVLLGEVAIVRPVATVKLKGKVIAADDKLPIPGVNIKVGSTNTGTQTDTSGMFTLEVPASVKTVRVAFIGYIPQEISVDSLSKNAVVLQLESQVMGEVVIIKHPFYKRWWYSFKRLF